MFSQQIDQCRRMAGVFSHEYPVTAPNPVLCQPENLATMLDVCDQVEGEQGDQDEQVHSQPMLGIVAFDGLVVSMQFYTVGYITKYNQYSR